MIECRDFDEIRVLAHRNLRIFNMKWITKMLFSCQHKSCFFVGILKCNPKEYKYIWCVRESLILYKYIHLLIDYALLNILKIWYGNTIYLKIIFMWSHFYAFYSFVIIYIMYSALQSKLIFPRSLISNIQLK